MEFVLPSSPVWYQTKASDTSSDGFFAFASRNVVYVFDISGEVPKHYGILSGHEERITACCFCYKNTKDDILRLVSGSDDCSLKIWNVMTKQIIHNNRLNGVGKITAVHWSPLMKHIIVFGDEKGCLIVWSLETLSSSKYFPDGGHQQISCVVCSPHYHHLVAVGYKSGAVSIIDIDNKGMVFRKLRGHGNEIHSIVWSKLPKENVFYSKFVQEHEKADGRSEYSSNTKIEAIVASGSKDRTIRLWSLSKGKVLKILKLPSKPSKGRRVNEDTARLYVALHWPHGSPSQFVSSSYNGDLLLWDVSKPDKEMCKVLSCNSPDSGHQRIVFNINQAAEPSTSIITTSMDRQIKMWSLDSPQSPPVWSLPTLGGYVYSIEISSVNPSMVAVGVGDGVIRVWKTRNPRNTFDITLLWQGIKEKVMSMAWHPNEEGTLAFGTEDGKVGLCDILSMRPPIISESFHLRPVYAMSWGPHCDVNCHKQSDLCLYTCGGEGVVFMHHQLLKEDAVDIASIISSTNAKHHPGRRSEISWRDDCQLVAVGNDNGTYDIYRAPTLQHVTTVKVHNKLINCLRWCPLSSDHSENHEAQCLIASGSNSSTVCVVNLHSVLQSENFTAKPSSTSANGSDSVPSHIVTDVYRTLCGHNGRITDLSWNANDTSQLVSASYDGTLEVWDVKQGEGIANYRGHGGRVLSVGWSSMEGKNGVIFSGADDYSVHVWKSDKQQNKMPPKDIQTVGFTQKQSSQWKRKNKKKQAPVNESHIMTPDVQHNVEVDGLVDIDELLESKKKELIKEMELNGDNQDSKNKAETSSEEQPIGLNPLAEAWKSLSPSTDILVELSNTRTAAMKKKEDDTNSHSNRRKRFKNLFPLSVPLDNMNKEKQQQDCIDIVKHDNEHLASFIHQRPNLGLYGNRKLAYRMLDKEDTKLVELDNHDGSYTLKLWRADIIGAVESAIERNDLTDQLVAMAPMAGYNVWLRACAAFADQLSKEGLHLHAANYLIACNKVREAVVLLRDNKHYREAVAMARARLPDDDELLTVTVKTWAYRLKTGGSFEMAAKCFASINEFRSAADCLAERASVKTASLNCDDIRSLFAATVLAKSVELVDWNQYAKRAVLDIATISGRWANGQSVAESFGTNLIEVRLILCLHEMLCLCLSKSLPNQVFSLTDLFTDHISTIYAESSDVTAASFATNTLNVWMQYILDGSDISKDITLFYFVETFLMQSQTSGLTLKQSLYRISLHLSCILLDSIISTSSITPQPHRSKQHLRTCREICNLGSPINSVLNNVYESVIHILQTADGVISCESSKPPSPGYVKDNFLTNSSSDVAVE